jgi:hypothetical protein
MSDAVIPPYPPSLTVQSWDKVKGLLARVFGAKTGVTELLAAAKKSFDDMPWEAATSLGQLAEYKRQGPEAIKQFQKNYNGTYQPKFRKLQTTYATLCSDLAEKAKAFEEDPKLVKFAPVLKKMSEDANRFTYAVSWPTVSDGMQKEILIIEKDFAERAKLAQERLKSVGPALEKVIKKLGEFKKAPPTPRDYASLFAQYHRLPGTYIGVASKDLPEIKPVFKDFLKYAAENWTQEPAAKTDMAKLVKADLEMLHKAKELAAEF